MEIGESLRNKALLGFGARPGGKQCEEQIEQIPAGGSAAGAWGLMNVLGSWPLIPCSESVSSVVHYVDSPMQFWESLQKWSPGGFQHIESESAVNKL